MSDRILLDSEAKIECEGVLTQTFGIRIHDGTIAPFSRKGQKYPCSGSYTFSTTEDFQDQITLEFHRSAESAATSDSLLGEVRIRGYKLEKAEQPLVRIHYELSNNEIVVWATNEKGREPLSLSIIKNAENKSVH